MKKQLVTVLTAAFLLPLMGQSLEGKMDLTKKSPENGCPQGWSLSAIKVGKGEVTKQPVVEIRLDDEEEPYLHLEGGNIMYNHIVFTDTQPIKEDEVVKLIAEVRPHYNNGFGIGVYGLKDGKFIRTFQNSNFSLKNKEWTKVTVTIKMDEVKGKKANSFRPVLIVYSRKTVDFRNVSWKVVPQASDADNTKQ